MSRGCRDADVLRRDRERQAAVSLAKIAGDAIRKRIEATNRRMPQLVFERGHPHVRKAARHDPGEWLQVVGHVDGKAMRGDPTRYVHADRGDLAVSHPHTRVVDALRAT